MAVWLMRAGEGGRYEQKFLKERRIYLARPGLSVNLDVMPDRDGMCRALGQTYPGAPHERLVSLVSQAWPFAHDIKKGDLVLMPLSEKPVIAVGDVTGDYRFEHAAPDPFYHWRSVSWIAEAVPRWFFGPDLLLTFAARCGLSRVHRNNAEARIAAMRAAGWKPEPDTAAAGTLDSPGDETGQGVSLEGLARDRIARLIAARFQGPRLTSLVEAILKARGYTTLCCGDDAGGVDILAATGPLGFAAPRLCIAVHCGDAPADRAAVDRLLDAGAKFGAQEGLFVSWCGFTPAAEKELAPVFFQVRLWSQQELLEELFAAYEGLGADMQAELPLKRIWIASPGDDAGAQH